VNKSLKEELESNFRDIRISIPEDSRMIISVWREQALNILRFLKEKGYGHLALISCVDWIEEKEFELVYIMAHYLSRNDEYTDKERLNIILKTRIPRENPQFETVVPIFKDAEAYEREIYELFGINFEGNQRLIPLFLERDYRIPPFRKDFDTREYVKEVFDKIPFVK
jgi:NADH-quinone oxidoreductase subunit C